MMRSNPELWKEICSGGVLSCATYYIHRRIAVNTQIPFLRPVIHRRSPTDVLRALSPPCCTALLQPHKRNVRVTFAYDCWEMYTSKVLHEFMGTLVEVAPIMNPSHTHTQARGHGVLPPPSLFLELAPLKSQIANYTAELQQLFCRCVQRERCYS